MSSEGLKSVWELHKDLVEELNGMLAPRTGDALIEPSWDKLAYRLQGPEFLTPVEIIRLKSMHDVFNILESKGIIQCGNYDSLKKIFKDIQLLQCHGIILSYEEKMKDIKAKEGTSELIYDREATAMVPMKQHMLSENKRQTGPEFREETRLQMKSMSNVTRCKDHLMEEMNLFCEQCNMFICGECMEESHQGHKLTTTKKIKSKQNELGDFIEQLQSKKDFLNKSLDNENSVYTQNTNCYEQIRKEISEHFKKIIETATSLRDEKFAELSSLQDKEDERHSNASANVRSQTQTLNSAIKVLQTGIDSGNPVTMEKVKHDANQQVQNVDFPHQPVKVVTKYKPGNINRPAVLPLFGDILDEGIGRKRPQTVKSFTYCKNKPPFVTQSKSENIKGKIITITTSRDTMFNIRVVLPMKQGISWVAAEFEKQLTLINQNGGILRESIKLCDGDSFIIDAKPYYDDVLVTCHKQHRIIRMSSDGKTMSTFSDLSPYYTLGLCVTHIMEILLCLKSTLSINDKDAKVVRLDGSGDVLQTIQFNDKGDAMYSWPHRVTSLPSGEIIVIERDKVMKVRCINNEGQVVFAWGGEVQGRQMDKFDPMYITHDKYNNLLIADRNNHTVYLLNKNGTEAKSLIDRTYGIQKPRWIAVDDRGHLWIGCDEGKIHVIKY